MKKITISLPLETIERLTELGKQTIRSKSGMVRYLIDRAWKRENAKEGEK